MSLACKSTIMPLRVLSTPATIDTSIACSTSGKVLAFLTRSYSDSCGAALSR